MGAAMERSDAEAIQETWRETKLPRPYPGGSYSVESMGRWVDKPMGDDRASREAEAPQEPLLVKQEDMPPDPEPVEMPESVPGGTESITKDADPGGEAALSS